MHDKDAAKNSLPGGGHRTLNETMLHGLPRMTPSATREAERSNALRTILLVEDDASLARLEAGILAAHGYTVSIAYNGEGAISAIRQAVPDLVLLDLELSSGISGWDVFKALRSFSSVPVLLTSAAEAVRRYMRSQGESRSTLDHLPKPYPMQVLLKRIERMLAMEP